MSSRMTKYSAAAVVALAAALILLSPLGTSKHGVVLAQVQKKVAQVDTMILRGQKIFSPMDDPNTSLSFDTVKYISRQYGYTEEGSLKGTPMYRAVLNEPQKQIAFLLLPWKKYVKFPCTDEQIEVLERLSPTGAIELLVLQTNHKRLGRATIDGVEAEGFEFYDVKSIQDIMPKSLFDVQQGKGTVWVGTKDLLPIRLEGDLLIGKSLATLFMDLHLHETGSLESYNIELGEELFNTDIPEDYTELKPTDLLPIKLNLADLISPAPRT